MMDNKKLLLFGTTMFSAELAEILHFQGCYDIIGYVVDKRYKNIDNFNNLPVYIFECLDTDLDMSGVEIVLSLGYSHMNENRRIKYEICKLKGYKVFTYISPQAIVYSDKIGEGSIVLPGSYIGPFSEVGICTVIRPGTVLSHHVSIGNYNWIADGCTFGGSVQMGNFCFLGLGTTVRNEISIADFTFIGAHSYVGINTEKCKAYFGVPLKAIEGINSYDAIRNV